MHRITRTLLLLLLLTGILPARELPAETRAAARPNILWITCEDMSPHLGCYGDAAARTPHIDGLAAQSIRYTKAFATAPVCSPARSCLITGMYATTLGTQHLRSQFPLPPQIRPFPEYLRAAGYYCSNNEKTDYNTSDEKTLIEAAWNRCDGQAHWRGRQPDQPFFSVFNLMTTHQSRTGVWPAEQFEQMIGGLLTPDERHDPQRIPVPPYYPETPVIARSLARYYDCVTAMDQQVGQILNQLADDGLAESTIVFFYSDHGMGMPRGKRTLYDTGLRVPLLIRVPAGLQHLVAEQPGSTSERLVSFVDFAPTLLSLLELPVPSPMQGSVFLGPHAAAPREYVHGARDRVDEAYDTSRSVRDNRYLYIRNFRPHLSWHQPEGYSDAAEVRREITRAAAAGQLNAAQSTYAGGERPLEELFDTHADPHQIHNLATSATHRATLERLRTELDRWILETRDLGFLPEDEIWNRCRLHSVTPWALAQDSQRYPLPSLLAAAKLVNGGSHVAAQVKLLRHPEAGSRYWAAVGLRAAGDRARREQLALQAALDDPSASVRIEAAGGLLRWHDNPQAIDVLTRALRGESLDAALHAARTLQSAGPRARAALPVMQEVLQQASQPPAADPHYLFLQFSLSETVERLQARP
jgi:N-sulfoglucosamine sulfohydrolase